jgi:uncharacterized protein (TIGR03435 family)
VERSRYLRGASARGTRIPVTVPSTISTRIRRTTKFGLVVFFSHAMFGQATSAPPAFEVASVRRDVSGGGGGATNIGRGGAFTATNSSLQALIRLAYGVKDHQIQGPNWMATERYDITAKPSGERENRETLLMLQNLLTERFELSLRREVRRMPVYGLVVAKTGSKLTESKEADSASISSSNHSVIGNRITTQVLARVLSGQMDRSVLDLTGLEGTFDVNLEWTPDGATADDPPPGPSIFTALQEQLGLKLESQVAPVEIIVIDHAEKIPTEN